MRVISKILLRGSGINVLSLCDGISCGQIALERAGIKVKKYYAAEIKDIAIKVTMKNYPNTIQLGDVNNISFKDGIIYSGNTEYKVGQIDLMIFGSPCQSFSLAMKSDKRIGLQDKIKSGLFLECYRILKEVNPKYFLIENVASMKDSDRDYITNLVGVNPIMIDSADISACSRKRYYWTNIENVSVPEKNNVCLQDILENGWTDREKGHCLLCSDSAPLITPVKMFHRYYQKGFNNLICKSEKHYNECKEYFDIHYKGLQAKDIPPDETDIFNGVRYLTQKEIERVQTVPEGYTNCLSRDDAADVLGDGWTVDVIAHIFKKYSIKYVQKEKQTNESQQTLQSV